MSGFLLDTNIPSEMPRPRPERNVAAWVSTLGKLHESKMCSKDAGVSELFLWNNVLP
jgi:hypothetical protein